MKQLEDLCFSVTTQQTLNHEKDHSEVENAKYNVMSQCFKVKVGKSQSVGIWLQMIKIFGGRD